ncbi:glycine zipper domain-containing protein [Mesorhizobium xinjiangense]|uniref:glycine zipper domain-containing protein n=1 Tax=Mesorhizobium xinjiangense TaxID=2678685 RepID=UPI0012EE24C6|nr:glycine zipper domain-containing protein [Mesorhizobium xinjiangense]
MKKTTFALMAMLAVSVSACTTAERDATTGGLVGAAIGGLATDSWGGAAVGGAVGAVSGVLIGKATRNGWCRYRDRNGRIYEARCR